MKKLLQKTKLLKIAAWLTLFFFTSQPLLFAAGAIVDGSQPAVQIRSENGVEIVDIANPNAQGLSHNKYQQFNVGPNGLVLSNSAGGYQSQITGGMVAGNPNLTGPAKTILNEVTAPNISHLNGKIEVGGNRADLIIANPNGIVGNGFGFINANRVVMTTGTPQIEGGNLTGFSVQQGHISLEGTAPLEVSGSKVALLSRTMQINTQIQADTIHAVSGQYDYDYTSGNVTATPSTDPKPQVGIDIAALGGMYANRIILVGTEKGVGVNSAGALSAIGGNIEISNDGKITLKDTQAAQVTVTAQDAEIVNLGDLTANQITLTGNAFTNEGTAASVDGTQLTFQIDEKIWNRGGMIHSVNHLNLITENIINEQGIIQSDQNLNIQGDDIVNSGTIEANQIILEGDRFSNQGTGAKITSQGDLQIHMTDTARNTLGAITSGNHLKITADSIVNDRGQISAAQNVQWAAQSILNQGGLSGAEIEISGDTFVNQGTAALIESQGNIHIDADSNIQNQQGSIQAQKDIATHSTSFINESGLFSAEKNIQIEADSIVNKRLDFATQDVTTQQQDWNLLYSDLPGGAGISMDQMVNGTANTSAKPTYTTIVEVTETTTTTTQVVQDTGAGTIEAGENLTMEAESILNDKSDLLAGKAMVLEADQITNIGLELQQTTTVEKWQVKKGWGFASSLGGSFGSSSMVVTSLGASQNSQSIGMAGGRISAEDSITLSADLLTHQTIGSQGAVIRDVIQGTDRESGALIESDVITIQADKVQNSGTIHGKEKASIQTQELVNSQGRILGDQLSIQTTGNLVNRNGEIHSNQDLFLKAENIINETTTGPWNQMGRYVANNSPTATAIISSDGDLTLQAKENIVLTGSGVVADGDVVVVAGKDIVSNTFAVQENSMLYGGYYVRWQGKFSGDQMNVGLNKQATYEVGSLIGAGKEIYLESGQNISLRAATVQANDDILTYSKGSTWITPGYSSFSMQQTGYDLSRIESVFRNPGNKFDRAFIERWYQNSNHYGVDVESGEMYAGGRIQIFSENNILLQSSLMSSLDGIDVVARRNVDILADKAGRWGDAFEENSKSKSRSNYGDEYVAPSYLVSDGDVTVVAGYLGDFFPPVEEELDEEAPPKKKVPVPAINPRQSIEYLYHDFEEDHEGRLRIQGSAIQAGKKVNLHASQDIIMDAIGLSYEDYYYSKSKKSNSLSKTKTTTVHHTLGETAYGSSIFGGSVEISAGGNVKMEGSEVLAINDLEITAGEDIEIIAAKNTQDDYHMKKVEKSGFSTAGITGVSYGKEKTKNTDWSHQEFYTGSAIGSLGGDVTLIAGGDVNVVGSSVQAVTGDIYIEGDDVNIDSAIAESDFHNRFEYKKSGVTISVSNGALDALSMAYDYSKVSRDAETDELRYTAGAKAALELNKAYESIPNSGNVKQAASNLTNASRRSEMMEGSVFESTAKNAEEKAGENLRNAANEENQKKEDAKIKVTISVGSQSMSSKQDTHVTTNYGSSIAAGGDVTIKARGDQEAEKEGDITIRGSQVSGDNVTLIAKEDVNIEASQKNQESSGSNKSSGWSVGVTVGAGAPSVGASVSGGKGKNRGDGVENIESTVTAKDTLVIISGDDTNIIGSQVSGNKVVADIGGDLNIESLQDSNNYHEKQTNWNVSASTTGSISGGYSKQKIDSEYKSVNEQAGIFAGEGGFDIRVEGNTDLKGAVIASEADADKNKISTGTISFSDIENEAEWESKTTGIRGTNKTPDNDKREQGISPNIGGSSDEDDSTTKSAISEGTIEIRDEENQKKDINELSRDTENANNPLKPIFDKDKILEKEQAAALFGEMGFEVAGKLAQEMGWDPGDPRRAALHGIIGGIMADINGGKFGDGLTTAMINKILIDQLVKNGVVDGAELRWISGILGVALDGGQGGSIAGSATKNNANLEEYTLEEKQKLYEELMKLQGKNGDPSATPEELHANLEKEMEHLSTKPEVIFIADISASLPAGKALPAALAEYISLGGTVIYDPKTETFFPGPSIGGGASLPSPVTGYVGQLYIPKEYENYSDEQRVEALTNLFSEPGASFSIVPGLGVIGIETKSGWLYGTAAGFDGAVSYGNLKNHNAWAKGIIEMPEEDFNAKYGNTDK